MPKKNTDGKYMILGIAHVGNAQHAVNMPSERKCKICSQKFIGTHTVKVKGTGYFYRPDGTQVMPTCTANTMDL